MDEDRYTCDLRTRMSGVSDERIASSVDSISEDYDEWGVKIVGALPADELDCDEDGWLWM